MHVFLHFCVYATSSYFRTAADQFTLHGCTHTETNSDPTSHCYQRCHCITFTITSISRRVVRKVFLQSVEDRNADAVLRSKTWLWGWKWNAVIAHKHTYMPTLFWEKKSASIFCRSKRFWWVITVSLDEKACSRNTCLNNVYVLLSWFTNCYEMLAK